MTEEKKPNKDLYYRPENNGINFGVIEEEVVGGYVDIDTIPDISPSFDGSKDWVKIEAEKEIQKTNFADLMDCTLETGINAYHIIVEFLNGWLIPINKPLFPSKNLSQRFNAKMSGVTQNGNTTSNADNSIENDGVCDEAVWPRNENLTWAQYYSSIPQKIKDIAKESLKYWKYRAYSISQDHKIMMKALNKGLLAATGAAWYLNKDGLYDDFGYRANHRFLIIGYVIGVKWIVLDSYPTDYIIDNNSTHQEFIKELDWDFHFGEVKLITVKPVDQETSKKKLNFLILLTTSMDDFYYYWDTTHKKHNFFYVGEPSGTKTKYRQAINLDEADTTTKLLLISLRKAMHQSSWPEVSRYPDISSIGKKFA